MRITLVHSRFNQLGGAERYALELAGGFAEAGHQVTILSTTPPPAGPWTSQLLRQPLAGRLWRHPSAAGKIYRHLVDLWPWRPAVSAQIAATTPDVVHLHNWMLIGAGAIRGIPAGIPVVHTVHDFALADPTTTLDTGHWSKPKTAVLAVRSRILAAQLRRVRFHWPSARTQRLAGAASPALLREPAVIIPLSARSTQRLGDVPDPAGLNESLPASFLFMGHLSEHKGVADLLAAWAQRPPAARLPACPARLVIAGDGPLRGVVETAAAQDPAISYLGYIDADRKRQVLADARWVVFPSRWHENFSITCVEALAAARPILCSQIAQPPMASPASLVVAGDSLAGGGRSVAGNEVAALAAALGHCAAMPAPDYLARARSARRDGAALLWSGHIQAIQDLLHQAVCETSQHVLDVHSR